MHGLIGTRVAFVAVLVLAGSLVGCAELMPYERGKLAHRTMKPGDGDSPGRAHVEAVQEGAVGGTHGASSGCGCN